MKKNVVPWLKGKRKKGGKLIKPAKPKIKKEKEGKKGNNNYIAQNARTKKKL
uniref:Uncharacterized protein n=1 Tax=Cucumis melo TaxID=3656 RepID=A0A9I9E6X5_CUCME